MGGLLLRYLVQLVLPGLAVLLWRLERRPILDLGFRRPSQLLRNLGLGLVTGALLVMILLAVESVAGWHVLTPLPWNQVLFLAIPANLFLAILVSFSEELTFRGYCLQRIELSMERQAGALLSSLVFALLHLSNLAASQLAVWQILLTLCSLLLLGLALAIGFVRTGGTLWFPWALHFAYNLIFGLQGVFFQIDHRGPIWWVGNVEWTPESGMLGLLFGIVLVTVVWWATQRREGYG
jgi:membrane protease YdiL (CAAX protease family)